MLKARKGVFETNSSSTHSICICLDEIDLNYPTTPIRLFYNDYGWERDTLISPEEKLSYLLTAMDNISSSKEEDLKNIKDWLDEEKIPYDSSSVDNSKNDCYIDHAYDTQSFVNYILSNKQAFLNFVFSNLSFILTGNDNDDLDTDIDESSLGYSNKVFYKGN